VNAPNPSAIRRRRVQAAGLAVILVGSAVESFVVAAELPAARDLVLMVVAVAMAAVIFLG